jgi:hypothetical protein
LGWPAIEEFGIEMRLATKSFFSSILNHTFELQRIEARSGRPASRRRLV